MAKQTRRQFIGTSVGGAVFAAGLARAQEAPAAMAIARWKGEPIMDEPTDVMAPKLARAALDAVGGMGRFVKKGDVVWIKPNMAWEQPPELAANTNPHLVAALVKMCLEAGAKTVKVGDNTCHDAKKSYVASGIEAAAKDAGAEVVYVDRDRFRSMKIGGEILKEIPVWPGMVESDLLISVPVAKHHGLSTVTLAMKNYMGVVESREKFHQNIPGCLADLTAFLKPRISVLDGIRILTANGPTGGDPKDVKRCNVVAASTDIIALDAFGAELLGYKPADISSIAAGVKLGLGEMDYRKLPAREIEVS